jgi:hypothetical protein
MALSARANSQSRQIRSVASSRDAGCVVAILFARNGRSVSENFEITFDKVGLKDAFQTLFGFQSVGESDLVVCERVVGYNSNEPEVTGKSRQ